MIKEERWRRVWNQAPIAEFLEHKRRFHFGKTAYLKAEKKKTGLWEVCSVCGKNIKNWSEVEDLRDGL